MMKYSKLLAWMLVMILAFGVVGCSDDDDDDPVGPTKTNYFQDAAEVGFTYFNDYSTANIPAATVYDNMLNDVDMFIIDWRRADAYAAGHIEGAVNWTAPDLVDNLDLLPTDMLIVNVCYSGQTASQITSAMHLLGYDNARNMLFGMCSWVAEGSWGNLTSYGYDLETTSNTMTETFDYPTDLNVVAADVDEALADAIDAYLTAGTQNKNAEDVYNMIADGEDVFVINYWPVADYEAGHIPGAFQLTPKSWDMDVLAQIPTDMPVVIYCYTGQTSSQVTMYLNALGYDAYSLLFGMNAINDTHPSNHGYTAPETDYPVVTE